MKKREEEILIYKTNRLPSGLVGIGVDTRDDPRIFKDRFWQKPIPPQPQNCYYEPGKQPELEMAHFPNLGRCGWVVARHPKPIGQPNYCVRVRSCAGWAEEDVRTLGGLDEISAALTILSRIRDEAMAGKEVLILVHAEPSQHDARSAHILWHILPEPVETALEKLREAEKWMKSSRLIILEQDGLAGSIGGWLDGQVNFFHESHRSFCSMAQELASWLVALIELFGRKFRSAEGLCPDFSILMRITSEGTFRYGMFFPKLRHMGSWELAAVTDGSSFSLACSWESMHRYLIGE